MMDRMLREDLKKGGLKSKIIYDKDPIVKRSFFYMRRYYEDNKRFIEDMELDIYNSSLEFHSQQVVDTDTIITIKILDPLFKKREVVDQDTVYTHTDWLFSLVSINKNDKAIVQVQTGTKWDKKGDWNIYKYRKICLLYTSDAADE